MEQKLYTKNEALSIYYEAAKLYRENLSNKDILLISKNKSNLDYYEISFRPTNYLHYTGVSTTLPAQRFFNKLITGKMNINDFEFADVFLNSKKADVIKEAMNFVYTSVMIGSYRGPKIKLRADIGVGNISYFLTFRYEQENNLHKLYPVGLNKDDTREMTAPTYPVVSILSKSHNSSLYTDVTYKSKNINIKEFHFPKEILQMLSPEAIQELRPDLYEKLMAQSNDKQPISNEKITENATVKETTKLETPSANKQDKEIAKSEAAPTIEHQSPIQKPKSFAEKLAEAKAKAEAHNKALQSAPPAKAINNNAPNLDD